MLSKTSFIPHPQLFRNLSISKVPCHQNVNDCLNTELRNLLNSFHGNVIPWRFVGGEQSEWSCSGTLLNITKLLRRINTWKKVYRVNTDILLTTLKREVLVLPKRSWWMTEGYPWKLNTTGLSAVKSSSNWFMSKLCACFLHIVSISWSVLWCKEIKNGNDEEPIEVKSHEIDDINNSKFERRNVFLQYPGCLNHLDGCFISAAT